MNDRAGDDSGEDEPFLRGLPAQRRAELGRVNAVGLARLRECLATGDAIAFAGAGASAPLYPLWNDVVAGLVAVASSRMTGAEAATCRELAGTSPDAVVEVVRARLRPEVYHEVLREVFEVRRDEAGRTWTATHELLVRCDFRAVVTTNYDPGIVDARMRVRTGASATGFVSWTDETALDRWRTGDVFRGRDVLPVLFAHGHHNQPEAIVLATTEYRRAYAGKLARVLGELMTAGRLVWVGFSFADQRIAAILREIAESSGTRIDPGTAPRHVAILPWDPDPVGAGQPRDPGVLRDLCAIQYAADVVLYPAPNGDHSALGALLERFVDPRFAAAGAPPAGPREATATRRSAPPAAPGRPADLGPVRWVHGGKPLERFAGRVEELAKLDRWAGDPEVRLVGVTAWGGAGKTALVTEWLAARGGAARRPDARGVFAWSFYENASEEGWAQALLAWARDALGIEIAGGRLADRVLRLAGSVPLVLVLDGLERVQEGPGGAAYGRLLGGLLRAVLTGLCRACHGTLAVLTSRFVFADLEQFDGTAARMLDVPAFTVAEGAQLLEWAGGGWLPGDRRRRLVAAVDGHALAVGALAGALQDQPPAGDVDALVGELERAGRTNARVQRVLAFYADRLDDRDRALTAIVALFQRPVSARTVLALSDGGVLGGVLDGWTPADVEGAVRQRLAGLLSWHPDGTVSAHPLVRDGFRPLALSADSARLASELELGDLPDGAVATREHARRIIEIVELLLDAGQWETADELFRARTNNGEVFKHLPAAGLGSRCELAFVATPERRRACNDELPQLRLGFYLAGAGLHAMNAGDVATAERYLQAAVDHERGTDDRRNLSIVLQNWSDCLAWRGDAGRAHAAADEALAFGTAIGDHDQMIHARAYLGWASHLAGQTTADEHFIAADRIWYEARAAHLCSLWGCQWGQLLLDSGRAEAAQRLTTANRATCADEGWNEDVARCDRLLARCDLAQDRPEPAFARLQAAAATFRDGDYVLELAETLAVLAEQRRRTGALDDAEQAGDEAIEIAAPRGLVPTQAAALAARARVRADRHATGDLHRARDDADHAHRLATRIRRLPWHELDALDAHARIDQAAGADGGWRARADALRATLVPATLDPDPPAIIEATAAATRPSSAHRPRRS